MPFDHRTKVRHVTTKNQHIGQVTNIDCSAAPLDIRPIFNAAVKNIDQALEKATADKPLMVFLGESHDNPLHVLLQYMLIKHYQDKGIDFDLNIEGSHDYWFKKHWFLPKGFKADHFQYPASNYLTLLCRLSLSTSLMAPVTMKRFLGFLLDQKISPFFNDASMRLFVNDAGLKSGYLNPYDPLTASYISEYYRDKKNSVPKKIEMVSAIGMAIRNMMMLDTALKRNEINKKRLIFQITGGAHVHGNVNPRMGEIDLPHEALSKIAENKDILTLSIVFDGSVNLTVPAEGYYPAKNGNKIFVQGASTETFSYSDYVVLHNPYAILFGKEFKDEAGFLAEVEKIIGVGMPVNDGHKYVDQYYDEKGTIKRSLFKRYKQNKPG